MFFIVLCLHEGEKNELKWCAFFLNTWDDLAAIMSGKYLQTLRLECSPEKSAFQELFSNHTSPYSAQGRRRLWWKTHKTEGLVGKGELGLSQRHFFGNANRERDSKNTEVRLRGADLGWANEWLPKHPHGTATTLNSRGGISLSPTSPRARAFMCKDGTLPDSYTGSSSRESAPLIRFHRLQCAWEERLHRRIADGRSDKC